MKKYLIILILLFLVGCSSKVEEEDIEEVSNEQYFTDIDKLINSSDKKQQSVVNINKAVDSNVTEKIRVTTKIITVTKEKVDELKQANEILKDKIDDVNSNVGIPYRLLPILSDSQNHR
jgi:peptidoglycan hydrolase CwlO-like protein